MDRSEAKVFLKRYRRLVERRRNIAERIKNIEDNATGTTARLDGMPRASGTGDKVGRGAADAADFRRQMERIDAEAWKACRSYDSHFDNVGGLIRLAP